MRIVLLNLDTFNGVALHLAINFGRNNIFAVFLLLILASSVYFPLFHGCFFSSQQKFFSFSLFVFHTFLMKLCQCYLFLSLFFFKCVSALFPSCSLIFQICFCEYAENFQGEKSGNCIQQCLYVELHLSWNGSFSELTRSHKNWRWKRWSNIWIDV